jgi:hypothetical protein
MSSETAGALEPDRVARAIGGRASVTCVQADSDCVLQSVEACSRRHGAEARRAILLVARKRARGVLLSALSGSLRRASQMLARSLEQVFAWRRVAGSVRRLRGSGGEGRRFGTVASQFPGEIARP